jgi:hydroxymethylbilane synthase
VSSRSSSVIRIATRGSDLALAQARRVLAECEAGFPDLGFEIRVIRTTGDRLQKASLRNPSVGLPKGLFTKELEVALERGDADLAVHSLKDLPTELPEGLRLGAVLPRADARDVLVGRARNLRVGRTGIPELPRGAVVATSSTRRGAQLKTQPDLHATVLAAAGLERLGIELGAGGRLSAPEHLAPEGWGAPLRGVLLTEDLMLPAPGQAAIGIECRKGDTLAARVCSRLNHRETRACVEAERAFLAAFGGGCQSPVAALGRWERGQTLRLEALVFDEDWMWREQAVGPASRPRALGAAMGRAAKRALGAR